MSYSIEMYSEPRVAVVTFEGKIDFEKDIDAIFQWVVEHQDQVVDVIHDVTHLNLTFSNLMLAAGAAFKPQSDRPSPDLDVVMVGLTGFFKGAASWLAQPQYGNRRVRVYDTLEEALQASRERAKVA